MIQRMFGIFSKRAVPQQIVDRARCIQHKLRHAGRIIICRHVLRLVSQRMNEYDRLAAIEFRVKLILFGLAKVAVADMGQQADPFELERIERVFGLTDRRSDIG